VSSDPGSGIDAMRARIERGRRLPPRPRRQGGPKAAPPTSTDAGTEAAVAEAAAAPSSTTPPSTPAATSGTGGEEGTAPRRRTPRSQERLSPSLPEANLAIRVRRPLDDRLADAIHDLRREGVRTSKVELVEMLLWELDASDLEGLRKRIARFRRVAPRTAAADLEA